MKYHVLIQIAALRTWFLKLIVIEELPSSQCYRSRPKDLRGAVGVRGVQRQLSSVGHKSLLIRVPARNEDSSLQRDQYFSAELDLRNRRGHDGGHLRTQIFQPAHSCEDVSRQLICWIQNCSRCFLFKHPKYSSTYYSLPMVSYFALVVLCKRDALTVLQAARLELRMLEKLVSAPLKSLRLCEPYSSFLLRRL